MFCKECEALGASCCEAAKERREMLGRMANLCDRLSEALTTARKERDAARIIAEDLMRLHSVKP